MCARTYVEANMKLSEQGALFIEKHEGFVSRAYRCPAGVWTIGHGFTNMSRTAVRMLGKIVPGKRITKEMSRRVLIEAVSNEYGPPVEKGLPGCNQHEYDAGCSVTFNCGPATMNDTWARLWRDGKKAQGWERLKSTRVTGGGRRLSGLVKRRKMEAALGMFGDYGHIPAAAKKLEYDADVFKAQADLSELGFGPLKTDGLLGSKTKAAVLAFQKVHPHLKNDGILGRATLEQIERALKAKDGAKTEGVRVGGGIAATIIGLFSAPQFWEWIAGAAAFVLVVFLIRYALKHREEIQSYINQKLGREVE